MLPESRFTANRSKFKIKFGSDSPAQAIIQRFLEKVVYFEGHE